MSAVASTVCPFCVADHPVHKPLAESTHWRLYRHADPVPIAGWMMLAARAHRSGLEAMSPEEADEIGSVLRALAEATRIVSGADRIYSITFNEAVPHLHIHIIPRFIAAPQTQSWTLADFYRGIVAGREKAVDPVEALDMAQRIATEFIRLLPRIPFEPAHHPD